MRLELSAWIEGDLEAIADYIAQDNPVCAVAFVRAIRQRLRSIGSTPEIYRLRPEIGEDPRLAVSGHYAILFRIAGDAVRIERVVHGARDLRTIVDGDAPNDA